jgi:class 3 adenylate cyclase
LYRFWWLHGHLAEGRTWLARALDRDARLGGDGSPAMKQARLRALKAAGVLARQQGDYRAADAHFAASLALARELNESVAIAESLFWLGSTLFWLGDEQRARALAVESLALYRKLGKPGETVRPLGTLANLARLSGNYEQAIGLHEARLRCAREDDPLQVAMIHVHLGILAGEQGQHDRATRLLEASYRTFEDLDYPEGMARALASLAWVARAQGALPLAKQQFGQSLALFQKLGATWGTSECLVGLARLAAEGAQFDLAARLFGSVAMLRETHSIRLADDQVAERAAGTRAATMEQDLEVVRTALGLTRFEALWRAGRGLTVDDAVTLALATVLNAARAAGENPGVGDVARQSFAVLLRRYRAAARLTQEELAERARMSARAISDLERGVRRFPYPDTVDGLAQALNLNAQQREGLLRARRPPDACADQVPQPREQAPTRPPAMREDERKLVAVVFAELVRSSSSAQEIDPEDLQKLLSRYQTRARADLLHFGGTVDKFIGNQLVAFFGAPAAHEDDPERAVHAALTVRDWLVEQDEGVKVRIGIASGEALVTSAALAAPEAQIAVGDVVNIAARLRVAAPLDSVIVDEQTFRRTKDGIEYRRAESLTLVGHGRAVDVWEAIRPLP